MSDYPDYEAEKQAGLAEYEAELRAAGHAPGGDILDEVERTLRRYVVLPGDHAYAAVTLWVAATHGQRAWQTATRLVVKSPEKRCGKTRLLDLVERLAHQALPAFNITIAALLRSIDPNDPPTLLLDEADAIWSKQKNGSEGAEDLRAALNAGFQRGKSMYRCSGPRQEVVRFEPFSMAAVAGIGETIPDTITDRGVVIRMRRRAPGEQIASFRIRRDEPVLHELRAKLANWISPCLDLLAEAEPDLPVDDRAADAWEPLVAIADLAGGEWPERARRACKAFVVDAEDEDAGATLAKQLLADLRIVFGDNLALHSATICDRLADLEESPWSDWYGRTFTQRDLARLLADYRVKACDVKLAGTTKRGYRRDDFVDAWSRYLAPVAGSATSATSVTGQVRGTPEVAGSTQQVLSATDDPLLTCEVAQVAQVAVPPPRCGNGYAENQHPGLCDCGWEAS